MEKKKKSLSLKNGAKSRKSKDTLPNPVTPNGNGKSFERSILQDFVSNPTNLSETPLSESRNYQGMESTEKCENRNFDFHCSFDTDSGTGQEINIPCTQLVCQEKILEGVVAFVEARSNTENRSEGISKQMEMLGARVTKKFTPEVTHVIFKDGKKTTREKALKRGIYLVSVLWVESCRQSGKRVSEDLFPVIDAEEIGTPLIIGKLKRTKSMQPKAFEEDVRNSAGERRRRRKMHAENLTPSAMIFCEETQDPSSPFVRRSPTTPHVVPDTPTHIAAGSFNFTKKLDYEDEPMDTTEPTSHAVNKSLDGNEGAPVVIPKLKRRLLSNRTPGKPVSTLKEAIETPTTETNKTPTDVLLTGSEPGRKRKRKESTKGSQPNEDIKGPTKAAKKFKLGGRTARGSDEFDGPGASSENKETAVGGVEAIKQTVDSLENKTSGNSTRQPRNVPIREDNDGGGSDSGVSLPDENSKSSINDTAIGARKKFSKTEKLVEQVSETQGVEEISDMERHDFKKKENAPKTTTDFTKKMKPNIKPNKPISHVKEHSTQLSKLLRNENPQKKHKNVESKATESKGTFADTETLQSVVEGSEEEEDDDDDDEEQRDGETCTEDEEQGSYKRGSSNTATKPRAKLVKKVKPKRSVVMTSMHFDQQDVVVSVVRKLGGFFIEDRVSAATSHVIAGSPRRTLNVLMAIAHGRWLVSPMWIMKSLEVGYWVDEEPYELSDAFPAAQLCRLERVSSGPGGYQQELLSDCAPIFVSENCSPPSDALMTLINICGGKVCVSARNSGICIGTMTRRTQAINITEQWLLDCITQHLVLPFTKYALNSPAKRGRETSPSY